MNREETLVKDERFFVLIRIEIMHKYNKKKIIIFLHKS